jgi:hypothetical protein
MQMQTSRKSDAIEREIRRKYVCACEKRNVHDLGAQLLT